MKNRILGTVLLGLALVVSGGAENLFTEVSVTDTAATTTLSNVQAEVMLCNYGANTAYFRLFSDADTVSAATTSYTKLPVGSPTCMSFQHGRTQTGMGWKAVSLVCDTGETATVHVISN